MTDFLKSIITSAIVSIVVLVIAVSFGMVGNNQPVPTSDSTDTNLGATGTRFPNGLAIGSGASVDTTGAFSVGNDGSQMSEIISGTCNAKQAVGSSFASTTVKTFVCRDVTGVASGDKIFISLPRPGSPHSFAIGGSRATTSNQFEFGLVNMSGAATTSYSQATTSVPYWIVR